ncbi:MAG: glycoside hydrolase family 38 C-terminal domain-containing protein [Verrucomicrobiota bacterium]
MKPPKVTDVIIHLVFSSHWDREWYLPFQHYREKLVRMLDEVFAHLESGKLPFYQMDGQFIPVEDYLEIRPEKERLVKQLIAAGKFRVGPWYDLPDEFLVSGESVVRNFLLGMKRSAAFGQTSKTGWLCDIFGHNSQMPQILRQLGIDNALLWRGVPFNLPGIIEWEGADGSRLLVHRFPANGYCDFEFEVPRCNERTNYPSTKKMVELALGQVERYRKFFPTKTFLFFDGGDHIEFRVEMLDFVKAFNKRAGKEVLRVSTLDTYIADLKTKLPAELTLFKGEMREPASMDTSGWLIPGVGSSRIPLKRANHAGETLLTLWAEPWCGIATTTLGLEYPATALELAWEYLLRNHPHDSICGCSTDETHNAMPYRFDQSRQLAEVHLQRAHEHLAADALRGKVGKTELGVSLFAPAGGSPQSCPEILVRLPKDWPQFNEFFGFETKPAFRIEDAAGKDVPYQLLEVIPATFHGRVPPDKMPWGEQRQGARLALDCAVAAGEQTNFVLKPVTGPTRIPQAGTIGVGRATLRNELLEVTAQPDGTLTLTDRQTHGTLTGLLAMEDTADVGDGWYHGVPTADAGFLSTGGNVTFGLRENGPLLARLHIRVEWLVPREFDFKNMRRGHDRAPLVVEHLVTLRKGAPLVEVDTTVHNTVRDHRLRLFCPTGADANSYWSDSAFDAVERPVGLRADNHTLRELQVEMTPQQNWITAGDLALLAPGQYESALLEQPDRPLCVTLLRAFRKAVFTDGNEGGQIQGSHTIRLGLKPGKTSATELYRLAQSLAAPVRAVYLDAQDLKEIKTRRQDGVVPRVDGDVVLSAQYRDGGRWVFRIFNPTGKAQTVKLTGGVWTQTDFVGENAKPVKESCRVAAKKIVTLHAE